MNLENESTEGTVISDDGTLINYLKTGNGPGIILVPGVLSVAQNYSQLAIFLSERFTVYSLERRGRGKSGPQGDDYSVVKECEDLDSLQKLTGAVYLFGHSYGGFIALEAAKKNKEFTKIAVYEPGISVDGSINMSWIPDYEKYLTANRDLAALAIFSVKAGPENAQKTPLWLMKLMMPLFIKGPKRVQMYDLLPANLREHQQIAIRDNTFPTYHEITAEVLLMSGGKSNLKWVNQALRVLKEVLPSSVSKEFPALNHFGPDQTGPAIIAKELINFVFGH
jgi:pimeloyl-ACP methyl ester carboxylesterase